MNVFYFTIKTNNIIIIMSCHFFLFRLCTIWLPGIIPIPVAARRFYYWHANFNMLFSDQLTDICCSIFLYIDRAHRWLFSNYSTNIAINSLLAVSSVDTQIKNYRKHITSMKEIASAKYHFQFASCIKIAFVRFKRICILQ